MATLTASVVAGTAKAVHTGVVTQTAKLSITATATASSVIKLCKVPHGATILGWWFYGATGGANQLVRIGTSNSSSGIASQFSLSTSAAHNWTEANDKLPVTISISDSVTVREVWLQAVLAVAISASADLRFTVMYTTDGTPGFYTIR